MKKTVLITGGAGFIGSHLTRKLLNNNYRVICIDNLSNYYNPYIKLKNISLFKTNPFYSFFKTNILNYKKIRDITNKNRVNIIIHLAGQPGTRLSFIKPLLYEKINIAGTYKILDLAKDLRLEKFIFASSSSVYGNNKTPFDEEKTTPKPVSVYGVSKLAGEHACFAYHKYFGLPVTVLRFFSVYGPNGRPDMAPYLFTDALFYNKTITLFGEGNSARDWTYIDDIVDGIYKVINKPMKYEIINLGNNKPVKLSRLIFLIEKITGKKLKKRILPSKKDEPDITYANSSKAKRLLGWRAKTEIETGLRKFINWYQAEKL